MLLTVDDTGCKRNLSMFQSSIGGRITVFQSILPSVGPGKLTSREDPNERAATVSICYMWHGLW